ncbi:MAG: hypothetical protein K0R39_1053 [Symbiobacteriaceae bacterium]|nr:hypothetical protein [Symbiobacteriaceae bacterium]
MKDPLQREQTPYEILDVDRTADRVRIERAFAAALGRRVPPNVAKNARDALLLHPAKRAWFDLLQYQDDVLAGLDPSPQSSAQALSREHRAATAQAWEQQLRRRFPDPRLVQVLAVFWYWWAVYEEERMQVLVKAAGGTTGLAPGKAPRQSLLKVVRKGEGVACDPTLGARCGRADCPWRDDCVSSAPPPKEMWERVIGYWSMLVNSPYIAQSVPGVADRDLEALRQQLTTTLHDRLADLPGRYDGQLSEPYRTLDSTLTVELESAQALAEVGLRTPAGPVAAGPLTLRLMGLMDAARAKVEAILQEKPGNRVLQRLRDMLMPHSAVAVLVSQRKPEAALAAIRELSPEQQKSGSVVLLLAQCYQMRARQKADMDRMDEAFADWARALESADQVHNQTVKNEVQQDIIDICHAKAAALGDHQRETAIAILKQALQMARGATTLELSLGALLLRKGVATFVQAQEELGRIRDLTDAIIAKFQLGHSYLEEAQKLGSKEAVEQERLARGFLAEALTARGIGRINEAQEQAKRQGEISAATMRAVQSGVEDLEKAERLGSSKAAEQAKVARELRAQMLAIHAHGGRLGRPTPPQTKGSGCASVIATFILLVAAVCTLAAVL